MWVALSIDKQLAIFDTRQRKIHQVAMCPCLKQSEIRAREKEEREKRAAAGEIVEDEEGDGRKGQAQGLF